MTDDRYLTEGATALENRLRKNLRHFGRWARRNAIACYRLYDLDLPEYAAAIDVYGERVHLQEYAPPATVDPALAGARLTDLVRATAIVLEVPPAAVFVKVRRRQRGLDQYEKQAESGERFEVGEGPCTFFVNLVDYLDTGLFLDHRDTRALLGRRAAGKRFLNLFCYTATATCHAALGGASASVSVDLSNTYVEWARCNFERNGLDPQRHRLIRADVLEWIERPPQELFDVVFLDPPTFSNSKRMQHNLDISRDHPWLIRSVLQHLTPDGTLIFSTNQRRFRLDQEALADLEVRDITRATLPKDFEANPRIHACFEIAWKSTPVASPGGPTRFHG